MIKSPVTDSNLGLVKPGSASAGFSAASHLDVAMVSPACSPRVSDEEVISILRSGSVSDEKDSVVKLGSALSVVGDNSVSVVLEHFLVGLNRD